MAVWGICSPHISSTADLLHVEFLLAPFYTAPSTAFTLLRNSVIPIHSRFAGNRAQVLASQKSRRSGLGSSEVGA